MVNSYDMNLNSPLVNEVVILLLSVVKSRLKNSFVVAIKRSCFTRSRSEVIRKKGGEKKRGGTDRSEVENLDS